MSIDPLRLPLRALMMPLQRLRRLIWSVKPRSVVGAHAVALTPEGKVLLVKLRYSRGWHVPGGGRKAGETALQNALRELTEETGMLSYGSIVQLLDEVELVNHRSDASGVFLVRDVIYRRRWTLEIEETVEADFDALPDDTSPRARRWIEAARRQLTAATSNQAT
jgi:8-oxo-dGTP pyrophosphatase MutT (NUDIX family)